MITLISTKLYGFISRNYFIAEDMTEIYQYGIEITLSSILNIILIICTSLLLGDILSGIAFLLCFVLLRKYCGGYHASTYFRCNTVFLLTYLLVHFSTMLISEMMEKYVWIAGIIILVTFIPILVFAPVKNVHRLLSTRDIRRCRLISVVVYVVFSLFAIFMCCVKIFYGTITIMTLVSVSVMMLVEILMQRRGYHEVQKGDSKETC